MHTNFVKLLYRLGLLKSINILSSRKVKKTKISIPVLGGIGLDNIYLPELWMCDLIEYGISVNPGFFIDIGVTIGQTLIKLRAIDRELPYVGFEPNAECVHYINRLVKLNNFKNINLIPVGLFSKNAVITLSLYSESGADPSASLIENFRKNNVPVFEYGGIESTKQMGRISMIKIDVEGAELEVLSSLKSVILENQPIVLIEILPAYDKDFTNRVERQNTIAVLMNELGYTILRVHKSKSK